MPSVALSRLMVSSSLFASQIHAHIRVRLAAELHLVLNAFRHLRSIHPNPKPAVFPDLPVLNALRHLRSIHTQSIPRPARRHSAQRLSTSQIHSPECFVLVAPSAPCS